ncbi:MAG: MBL fold metallo-hydrolase [Firmicutes bacterium]|nr:MBL fold metallo-hydrolase [Bacillota bacterium]
MRLTILGHNSPFPSPGGATLGYLVEEGSRRVLLDCGTGISARLLQRLTDLSELDAVVVTHLHPDHSADLFPLGFAALRAVSQCIRKDKLPLYLPAGSLGRFEALLGIVGDLGGSFSKAYEYIEYTSSTRAVFGDLEISFSPGVHALDSHAVRACTRGPSGSCLAYTGDTRYSESLVEFCSGVDLLLTEVSVDTPEEAARTNHLTAPDVAKLSTKAGVRRVVLTHFMPGAPMCERAHRVKSEFLGPVDVAMDFVSWEL